MESDKKIMLTHTQLPLEQQEIHARCHHPTGAFSEFAREELERSITARFERIVHMYPEQIAVKTHDSAVSYAELNLLANTAAHAILSEHGSEPEPVALLIEKGAPLFAAMMGVLKTGKFFVPFDPSLPEARIVTGLDDSEARLIVTNRQHAPLAKRLTGRTRQVIEFDFVRAKYPSQNPGVTISPEALAYIVYTSGSTGEPKAVIQNHRHILHLVMLRTHAYHICKYDRIAHLTSATGNAVSNVFVPLLNGAVLQSLDMQAHGVSQLTNWLVEERISICPIGSPLFRNWVQALTGAEDFADLRVLRLSTDAVHRSDLELFRKCFPTSCILATGLSSTETGPVTSYFMDHSSTIPTDEPPLGYPLSGKEVMLLDDEGREVPLGEVGEIAIRSRYLSPGYWRRLELSSSKFLPDATGGDKRIYLSADLGCMLPDGCLVYKGRKDFRVKVRGYGVEFAEVEKALLEHSEVKEALVTTRQSSAGETELIAYVTLKEGHLTVNQLRAFLEGKLPQYMIPSLFVILDAMPIAASGKLDRRALPAIGRARPELEALFVPPQTGVQQALANIWSEVLSISPIGIHDRFLDLGGTSLSATRVLSRVFKRYQLELSIQSLFQSPTIAEMSKVITQTRAEKIDDQELARIMADLESLSDEQAQQSLREKEGPAGFSTIGKTHPYRSCARDRTIK